MAWRTEYLSETGRTLGHTLDRFPYHAALGLTVGGDRALLDRRLDNLARAITAERMRPERIDHVPYHLVVDVSDICNLACPLCVQATDPKGRKRTTLVAALAQQAFSAFDQLPIRVELFNWGEPLLNPAFNAIVRLAGEQFLFTRTSSHLSLPRPLDAEALIHSGLKSLVVSIDGASQETYERYRIGGELECTLANLRALVAAKRRLGAVFPIVEWQFLCLRYNVHEAERAHALAKEIGVDIFRCGGARGLMAERNSAGDEANYTASAAHLLDGDHHYSEYDAGGLRRNAWEREGCRWLWGKLAVHADGGVAPCWTSWRKGEDFGNLRNESLEALWSGETFLSARRTATGDGKGEGAARTCERCAAKRAFVNAPERPAAWPTEAALEALQEDLTRWGHVEGIALAEMGARHVNQVEVS